MPTTDSRDIIHALLEANQAELLLRAALEHGDNANFDGDVLRALMQTALAEGDMETVRNTATRLIDLGIGHSNLMLALEGLCLLRNVGGDTEVFHNRILDALDARGFSADTTIDYTAWEPNVAAAQANTDPCPPAGTVLALLSERVLPPSLEPFAWVTLWPQLDRAGRSELMNALHFEMRMPGDAALQPPRIIVAWVISGEVTADGRPVRCVPGTMLTHNAQSHRLHGGRHLRMLGLREERWEQLMNHPSIQAAWQQIQIRNLAIQALESLGPNTRLSSEALQGLLRRASLSPSGSAGGSDVEARIFLVIDGHLELPLRRDTEVIVSTVGPGTLLSIPAGVAMADLRARVLRWSENTFAQFAPLNQYTIVEVASEAPANQRSQA